MKPYVISGELELAGVDKDRLAEFRADLMTDLACLGKQVQWVDARELAGGLNRLIDESDIPVVTLDARYVRPGLGAGVLAVSRCVDRSLRDAGYGNRIGSTSLTAQLDAIGRQFVGKQIALADDVLFTGGFIEWLADELEARGAQVTSLLAGVAIGDGVRRLTDRGIAVQAVRNFEKVEDELCERDLALVPGSGRKLADEEITALYFDPVYGRPDNWASIPSEAARAFGVRCLKRSLALIRPGTDISELGNFLGYPSRGDARQILNERIGQLLKAEAMA